MVVESDTIELSPEDKSPELIQRALPDVPKSAALDLIARSRQKRRIVIPPRALNSNVRVLQPPASEVDKIFNAGGQLDKQWEVFQKRFGATEILRFSRVGFDPTFDNAVFLLGHSCGPLCGGEILVHMNRGTAGWVLKKDSALSIS